jgi:hypothetical protein
MSSCTIDFDIPCVRANSSIMCGPPPPLDGIMHLVIGLSWVFVKLNYCIK